MQRKLELQHELSDLGLQSLVKSKSKQEIISVIFCEMHTNSALSQPCKPAIKIIESLSEDACSQSIQEEDSGVEIASEPSRQIKDLQLKESLLNQERKQDGKLELQFSELQREMCAFKLQQAANVVVHKSIVEALEAAAEEKQVIFVAQTGELAKELERSKNESTSSQLKVSILLEELDKVRGHYQEAEAELCQTLIVEKRQRVNEAVLASSLSDKVSTLEGQIELMFQSNTKLKAQRDQQADASEEHHNQFKSFKFGDLERCNDLKGTVLKEIQEKKTRKKARRKLKCW